LTPNAAGFSIHIARLYNNLFYGKDTNFGALRCPKLYSGWEGTHHVFNSLSLGHRLCRADTGLEKGYLVAVVPRGEERFDGNNKLYDLMRTFLVS